MRSKVLKRILSNTPEEVVNSIRAYDDSVVGTARSPKEKGDADEKNKKRQLEFRGVDRWNRPVFADREGRFYGSVDDLFHFEATYGEVAEHVTEDDVCYFGRSFGCEPDGSPVDPGEIELVERFDPPEPKKR